MKNMSFGKMMAIFGGFVVLLIIITVVIIKMTAGRPPAAQVTMKKYQPTPQVETPAHQPEQVAEVAPLAAGQPLQAARQQPAADMGIDQTTGTAQPDTKTAPVVLADVKPHLSSLDASINELQTRVTALENRPRSETSATTNAPPTRRPNQKPRPASTKVVVVREVPVTPITPLLGYKSMAVIGNRAWVATPDGQEDSASPGEPLPNLRVRSLNKETGVVITTSDQRIGAH